MTSVSRAQSGLCTHREVTPVATSHAIGGCGTAVGVPSVVRRIAVGLAIRRCVGRLESVTETVKKAIEESCRGRHDSKSQQAKANEANSHTPLHTLTSRCHGVGPCSRLTRHREAANTNVLLRRKLRRDIGPG